MQLAPTPIQAPDGRRLDLWLDGPEDGTPLVFHSGTVGAGIPYPTLVRLLADRGLRYVSVSRPGYGSSTRQPGRSVADVVEDTRTALDFVGADRAWILGWSGGGPHAMACAALMPDQVLGTALIASVAPYDAEGLDYLAGMGAENVEEFGATLEGPDALLAIMERDAPRMRSVTLERVASPKGDLTSDVDRRSYSDDYAEYIVALCHEALREGYWGWFDDDMAFVKPWGFDVGTIRDPVHIWQGGQDRMVPYAHGEWLAAHVGGACAHLDPDQGHRSLVVDSMPRIVDELIRPAGSHQR
jgi:pimeloyl-ACP methyl ester carboxylesterase